MNKRKLRFTVLSILVLAAACIFMLAGCGGGGGDTSPTEIYIEKSLQPRILYVEGQELDFSTGALTYVKDGEHIRIPLSDEKITATGYDKNLVGNQTITISYEEMSTTLTVGVIARMVVENAETSYFVGESFNQSKGRIKVANDNAETSYVSMSSEAVTIKSFDSSKGGTATVVIEYRDGDNAYECSFDVEVYEPDVVTFVKPKKNEYLNHVTELDLSGGYLLIKAASPSTFSKSISLSQDMISGYNPDAVTLANRDTALEQIITVSYATKQWNFSIKVYYSGVYVIQDNAEKISGVNLDVEDITAIEISDSAGKAAQEAMEEYFLLSDSDKELLDDELVLSFARIAAFYVNTQVYVAANTELSNAFIYSPNGQLMYVGSSYQDVKDAIAALNDPDSKYNSSANLLLQIKESFGSEQFNSQYMISSLTSVHTTEIANIIAARLQHIIDVYDTLVTVPSTWSALSSEEFKTYEDAVFAAVNKIRQSEYTGPSYSGMYQVVTNWRSDFFEIIYSYYYYVADGGQDKIVNELWGVVPAPGLLQDFYVMYNNAYTQVSLVTQYSSSSPSDVFMYDLYQFHYYYKRTLEIADEIKASGNELYTTIYDSINLDAYIETYLNAPSPYIIGYYDFIAGGINSQGIRKALDSYCAVLDIYYNEGTIEWTESNKSKIKAVFDDLTALSPAELHWFLSSLSFRYHNSRGSLLIFDYSAGSRNLLVDVIAYYYLNQLPEASHDMLLNLLLAMESYSLSFYKDSAIEDFEAYMDKVAADYEALSSNDKETFNSLLGACYKKYYNIRNMLNDQSLISAGDMSDKLDELLATLKEFDRMFEITQDTSNANQQQAYPMLIALYDKATAIYNELTSAAQSNSAIADTLSVKLYEINEDCSDTLDKYYFDICAYANDIMLANGEVWYANNVAKTREFILKILPLMYAAFDNQLYEGDIEEFITLFRALSSDEKYAFYTIQANRLYYAGLEAYFNAQLSNDAVACAIVADLFNAEIYYSLYEMASEDTEALDTFKEAMESAIEKHASLTSEDQEVIDEIYYSYYLEKYYALPADEAAT